MVILIYKICRARCWRKIYNTEACALETVADAIQYVEQGLHGTELEEECTNTHEDNKHIECGTILEMQSYA